MTEEALPAPHYTASELLAVMASRLLRDGQIVFAGVGVPLLAATLAQRSHAPHLTILFEGGTIGPFIVPGQLPPSTNEQRCTRRANMQFSGILPALQAGTLDFVAAPVTVTKERADNYIFTEGYLNTDYQFLTKKGEPPITDLKQFKGKVIAVNKGAVYDSWARGLEAEIGWSVESFGTQTDAVQAVLAGRAYANVAGNTAIQWAVKQQPQLQLSYLHSTGLVWAMMTTSAPSASRNALPTAIIFSSALSLAAVSATLISSGRSPARRSISPNCRR